MTLLLSVLLLPALSLVIDARTPPEKPKCTVKVDVGFILDSSGSIRKYYQEEKDFVKSLAGAFGVSDDGSRAGVVTFSSRAAHSIKLKDYKDITSFNKAVDAIPHMAGGTRMDAGLRLAQKEFFAPENGARSEVPKILILLTDGVQYGGEDPALVAKELRAAGIRVIVVGMGSGVSMKELNDIAGSPDDVYAASFDNLVGDEFVKKLTEKMCNEASVDDEVRPGFSYRSDGRCGDLYHVNGKRGECKGESYAPCCSSDGYCGRSPSHCYCPECIDYSKPNKLPPVKCERKWKKVGCFNDDYLNHNGIRVLPTDALNQRDPSNPRWDMRRINWLQWDESMHTLACLCADKARQLGHSYFGLQFYGECWTGSNTNVARDGPSKNCIGPKFKKCDDSSQSECVGGESTNYIYDITPQPPTPVRLPAPANFQAISSAARPKCKNFHCPRKDDRNNQRDVNDCEITYLDNHKRQKVVSFTLTKEKRKSKGCPRSSYFLINRGKTVRVQSGCKAKFEICFGR